MEHIPAAETPANRASRASQAIRCSVDGEGIATVVFDMPDRPVNVLNQASSQEFAKAIETAIVNDQVKGIIITSAKESFLAGGDLQMLEQMATGSDEISRETWAASLFQAITGWHAVLRRLETSAKPVLAAINGTAMGGGFELCLACHCRIAADNPNTRIGLPEVRLGLLPGAGGTQRLPRLIGLKAALPLLLEGRAVDLPTALALGMIDKIVPAPELLIEAKRWLREQGHSTQPWDQSGYGVPGGDSRTPAGRELIAAAEKGLGQQSFRAYPAPKAILACLKEGLAEPLETGLQIEARHATALLLDPVTRLLIQAHYQRLKSE